MATLDDSPSLFSGQQWTDWAENVLSDLSIDDDTSPKKEKEKIVTDSMKLKKEDMPLFGLCPSQDEFYLVVCDKCNQVLKPQAFQRHLETRHGGKEFHSSKQPSSRHHVSKKSPSKSAHLHTSPHKNSAPPSFKSHRSSGGASVKEPPPSFNADLKVGAKVNTSKQEDSKIKKKHSVPVVEVERMPEIKSVKKEKNVTSAGNFISNGAVKTESHVPLEEPIKDLDIKPPVSPHPALSAPPSPSPAHTSPATLSPALASEVDTAVSSILEPVSEAETEMETSSIAMATPLVSMTTTTVTTASITKSATTVTNVTNTTSATSVFSCSGKLRLGGSHFTLGNINYSDTGILRTLNAGVDNSSSSGNKNNNSPFLLKSGVTSTISSPLKSTVSMSNVLSNVQTTGIVQSTATLQSASSLPNSKSFTSVKSSCSISGNLVINAVVSSSSVKPNLTVPPVISSPTVVNIVTNASTGFKPNVIKSFSASAKFAGAGKSNANVHRTGTGLKSGLSSEELLKKYPAVEKPDKIIPLKDREYDPNKHCGVIIADTGKACTRSLTCKSHALSLRRAVPGRRLPFDELLQEHREAKDAYLLAKAESRKTSSINKPHLPSQDFPKPKAHLISNLSSVKENKVVPTLGQITQKSQVIPNSAGLFVTRPSLTNLHIPSPSLRGDDIRSPPDKPPGKLLTDDEEEKEKDDSYTTHHPRPIAACSFGARYHNSYNGGFGCHSFGRRTDHLRSSFLDMLERHLHPPPPKKLCVESNLPREAESQLNAKDPYDFGLPDGSKPHGIPVQRLNTVIASVPNKLIVKQKPLNKQNTSVNLNVTKPKSREGTSGTNSAALPSAPVLSTGLSSAKKRRSSGSGAVTGAITNTTGLITSIGTPAGTSPSFIGTVGTVNVNSSIGNNPPFAIAIPSVISAKQAKNNVGFVVAGIPHDAILNGQCVNIASGPISDLNTSQVTLEDKSGQAHVINANKTTPTKYINSINSLEAIRAIHKNNLITNLPPNTLLVEGGLQPGTVLAPVSITTPAVTNPVATGGHTAFSPHQQSPSTTPSPLVRSGSVSPQVSTSPLPNGVVSSPSEKEGLLSHRHPVFQTKGPSPLGMQRGTSHQSHVPASQSQSFSYTSSVPNSSANQISASQVFTTQFTQLQMKNSNIHNKPTGNKLTMQPVSLTIPFVSQASLGGVNVVGQRPTHALFITSEEAQKQGIHLQTAEQQAQNSPSSTIIS